MLSNDPLMSIAVLERLSRMPPRALLGLALKVDVAVSAANGVAYVAGAPLLRSLGLSTASLRFVGAALLAFAAAVYYVASRRPVAPKAVLVVVLLNAIWVLDSLLALAAGWLTPPMAGAAWIVLQALAVAALAGLQWSALRRGWPKKLSAAQ